MLPARFLSALGAIMRTVLLLLTDQQYDEAANAITHVFGRVGSEKYRILDGTSGEQPDLVVLGDSARKSDYLRAGFWRGYGVPVVMVSRSGDRKVSARVFAVYGVNSVLELVQLLQSDHPYLSLKPNRPAESHAARELATRLTTQVEGSND